MSAGGAAGALTGEDKLHHQSQRLPKFLALRWSVLTHPLSFPRGKQLSASCCYLLAAVHVTETSGEP
jgi:hypothetical protein